MCYKVFGLICLFAIGCAMRIREKRQLFRDDLGRKIPDAALKPERLVLNKLDQNGFYSIDGVLLEHRMPDVRSGPRKYPAPTLKLAIGQDKKYSIASEYGYNPNRIVDTTYRIRKPIHFNVNNLNFIRFRDLPVLTKRKKANSISNKEIQILFKDLEPYLKKLHSYD